MNGFAGRRALVTGAGKGIGREVVQQLVARGADVVALSRSMEDLAALRDETGCQVIAVELENIDGALDAIRAHAGFDLLVNNAGISMLDPVLDVSQDVFEKVIRVNTVVPLRLAQMVAKGLIGQNKSGAIVNVSSIAARQGLPFHAAYCASKAGLDALTRVMAVEFGPHRIRVNSVNPTVTLTPMAAKAWSDASKSGPMLARIPLGRFVEVNEVAEAICFLLSDAASMINGICLEVDGGFSAS